MSPYFHWSPDPVIFRLGPLAPRWYGLLFALGFLIGFYLMQRVFEREDRPIKDLDALLMYLLGGTVIGARLGHVLFYAPGYYFAHPLEIPQVWEGGLASHGGLIGVLLAIWLYSRSRQDQPFLWLTDRLAPPIALTGAFIRLGNFFNSEILGTPTDVSWAVVFERVSPVPRHPAQLYEAISYFIIFVLLQRIYERQGSDTPRGFLTGLFMLLIFGVRFFIEFVKMRQATFGEALPLSMGQLLSLPAIALGIWLIVRSRNAQTRQPSYRR
ncbi:prolipoprotein diacylglyceryl transferase [Salisaeta longa]|uniref:prolipoprotein diacylglyceryl transferase n=1 Tax=Salisaeta longa TaxID=503170 RepID=UPI0003B78F0A|nr:prolipoprotein diacylglyceryl transferase [Salisaeta longa]